MSKSGIGWTNYTCQLNTSVNNAMEIIHRQLNPELWRIHILKRIAQESEEQGVNDYMTSINQEIIDMLIERLGHE